MIFCSMGSFCFLTVHVVYLVLLSGCLMLTDKDKLDSVILFIALVADIEACVYIVGSLFSRNILILYHIILRITLTVHRNFTEMSCFLYTVIALS